MTTIGRENDVSETVGDELERKNACRPLSEVEIVCSEDFFGHFGGGNDDGGDLAEFKVHQRAVNVG